MAITIEASGVLAAPAKTATKPTPASNENGISSTGAKATVPDAIQGDGSVSYTQGYGINYTLDPNTDPAALDIEQTKMNQLFYDITYAIQQYQQNSAAPWITSAMNGGSPYSYPANAIVLYSGVVYQSLKASNTATPGTDITRWVAVTPRYKLTGALTLYVATTGNDSTGIGTSGSPWATLQHAVDFVANNIDLGGYSVTIQVADGTYTTGALVNAPFIGKGTVLLQGNNATPANCIISTTNADCIDAIGTGINLSVSGFTLQTTTSGSGIYARYGAVVSHSNMNFGAVAGGGSGHQTADSGGKIFPLTNYTISGSCARHYYCNLGGLISCSSITVTLTGTPAFSSAFADIENSSTLGVQSITFSGSATGVRYLSGANSVIQTSGAGATYLPGNSAGSTSGGGQYL